MAESRLEWEIRIVLKSFRSSFDSAGAADLRAQMVTAQHLLDDLRGDVTTVEDWIVLRKAYAELDRLMSASRTGRTATRRAGARMDASPSTIPFEIDSDTATLDASGQLPAGEHVASQSPDQATTGAAAHTEARTPD
jgi:hypothetical protein